MKKQWLNCWGQGRAASPGKLNVKTGPLLADISIFNILLLFSRLFFTPFGVLCFLASIDLHEVQVPPLLRQHYDNVDLMLFH